jgi:CSLREA domain-containing protein
MNRHGSILPATFRALSVLILMVASSLAMPVPAALADTTITVTTFSDMVANDGVCSLREAITSANTNTASGAAAGECPAGATGADTIQLPAGTYTLSIAGTPEDNNASGDLDIKSDINLIGLRGAEGTIIDGNQIDRVIHVVANNPAYVVTLQGVTVRGGRAPNGADGTASAYATAGQAGGGIYNGGKLTVAAVAVTDNASGNGGNGANNSTYSSGAIGGSGGGIYNTGTLTVTSSTIGSNTTGNGGTGWSAPNNGTGGHAGRGGGIYNDSFATATIRGSTISGNRTGNGGSGYTVGAAGDGGHGGGIGTVSNLVLENSTVSGNTTGGSAYWSGRGGGVFHSTGGTLTINASTIAGNVITAGGVNGSGGGIHLASGTGITNSIKNTIIAGNIVPGSTADRDCYAFNTTFHSQGYDLVGYLDKTVCKISGSVSTIYSNTSALLLSLGYEGGPTQGHALHPSSPAKDRIPNAVNGCGVSPLNVDQRGEPRPANSSCDIGAFELQATETITQRTGLAPGVTTYFTGADVYVANAASSTFTGTVTVDKHDQAPPNLNPASLAAVPVYWNVGAYPSPYTLTVSFGYSHTQLGGIAEADLTAYRWDTVQSAWISMGGTLDTGSDLVRVTNVSSAGDWMLAGRTCFVRLNDSPTDYATIQAAVDASASSGDVVKVAGACGGVSFRAGITQTVYLTKTLTIQGGYTSANWATPDPLANPSIVSAGGLGRVFAISGTISPILDGLRITGGDARGLKGGSPAGEDVGGGIAIGQATATITNSHIYGNAADDGAGVSLGQSNSTFAGNTIYANVAGARNGGSGGGFSVYESTPVLINNLIISNSAVYSETNDRGGDGGGIQLLRSTPVLQNNTVRGNSAGWGGGMSLVECAGGIISGNHFVTNTADWGGGLGVFQLDDGTITNNEISGNTAEVDAGGLAIEDSAITVTLNVMTSNTATGGSAGGIRIDQSAGSLISGNTVMSNTANFSGAGVFVNGDPLLVNNVIMYNQGNDGAGVHIADGSPVLWSNNVSRNYANSQGGGIKVDGGAPWISNTLIIGNQATWEGAGILVHGATATFVNPVLVENDLTDGTLGAGIWITSGQVTLLHPTIVNNHRSAGPSHGIYLKGPQTAITVTNAIVAVQLVGVYGESGATATIDGVLWYGNGGDTGGPGVTVTHAYSGDPRFAADGYHLTGGSAAIDRGVSSIVTTDIDGQSRSTGGAPDLGADEFDGFKAYLPLVVRSQ